jgi:hypothetical protein
VKVARRDGPSVRARTRGHRSTRDGHLEVVKQEMAGDLHEPQVRLHDRVAGGALPLLGRGRARRRGGRLLAAEEPGLCARGHC